MNSLNTPSDFDKELEREILIRIGPKPSIETLKRSGIAENTGLIKALDGIQAIGRVSTLFIAELIQSLAALVIAGLFGALEYQRVFNGAVTLGQSAWAAGLIAVCLVAANIIHPVITVRANRGHVTAPAARYSNTLRGYVMQFIRWLFGKPRLIDSSPDPLSNRALQAGATVITGATLFLAINDVLGPLLLQVFQGTFTKPIPIMVFDLAMGGLLSLTGVLFLQAAAHDIATRLLTDQPVRIADTLEARVNRWQEQADLIYQDAQNRRRDQELNALKQAFDQAVQTVQKSDQTVQALNALNTEQAIKIADLEARLNRRESRLNRRSARIEQENGVIAGGLLNTEHAPRQYRIAPVQTVQPVQKSVSTMVFEHLINNPDDSGLSVRSLAKKLNVSVGSAQTGLNNYKTLQITPAQPEPIENEVN